MSKFMPIGPWGISKDLSKIKPTVRKEDYEQFKKEYIFDGLRGLRFGQAFCEKFDISDYLISSIKDNNEAQFLIETLGYLK